MGWDGHVWPLPKYVSWMVTTEMAKIVSTTTREITAMHTMYRIFDKYPQCANVLQRIIFLSFSNHNFQTIKIKSL